MKVLMKQYIKFPSGDDFDRVVDEFKSKWGIPQCFGAIDGCHIPICAPSEQHTDYYNRKAWYSMIVQGLVDANYHFLVVSCSQTAIFSFMLGREKIESGECPI